MTWSRIVLFSAAVLLFASQHSRAAPLDADTCSKLDAERLQLEFAGVRGNVAKGPEWAKTAKLSAEALGQIRRLIDIDAQLLFRCTGANLVNLPTDPPDKEAATPNEPAEDGNEGQAHAEPPKGTPAAKAKPDTTKPKKAVTTPPAKVPGTKAAPADKGKPAKKAPERKAGSEKAPPAKAKPKADDAYKPPAPADPNANPFAAKATPPK
jgi:hypothetical protein